MKRKHYGLARYDLFCAQVNLRQQWDKAQGLEKDKLAEQLKTKIQMLDILRELHVLLGTLDY